VAVRAGQQGRREKRSHHTRVYVLTLPLAARPQRSRRLGRAKCRVDACPVPPQPCPPQLRPPACKRRIFGHFHARQGYRRRMRASVWTARLCGRRVCEVISVSCRTHAACAVCLYLRRECSSSLWLKIASAALRMATRRGDSVGSCSSLCHTPAIFAMRTVSRLGLEAFPSTRLAATAPQAATSRASI